MEQQWWEQSEKRRVRRERVRGERGRRERGSRKNPKVRNVFFQCFLAVEDRKVGSLNRRVRSHVQDERSKIVARSGCGSQKGKSISFSDRFWKLRCAKTARRCDAKHISKFKCASWDVEKVHAIPARSTFAKSKCEKHTTLGPLLDVQPSLFVAGEMASAPSQIELNVWDRSS